MKDRTSLKDKIVTIAAIILALTLIVGITAVAASNYGTSSDPLITLSYLTDTFKPAVMSELDTKLKEAVAALEKSFDEKIAAAGNGAGQSFEVVTLSSGQKIKASVGTEIMLRVGTASCAAANSPGLINITTGGSIESGAALTTNHMYMVTIEGNGITATAATVKVLIRGSYTIE